MWLCEQASPDDLCCHLAEVLIHCVLKTLDALGPTLCSSGRDLSLGQALQPYFVGRWGIRELCLKDCFRILNCKSIM